MIVTAAVADRSRAGLRLKSQRTGIKARNVFAS